MVRKTQKGHRNYLRVRGEYATHTRRGCRGGELPPRARRIQVPHGEDSDPVGTTSACAENTVLGFPLRSLSWNYLRVRGEYGIGVGMGCPFGELPPRARRILTP